MNISVIKQAYKDLVRMPVELDPVLLFKPTPESKIASLFRGLKELLGLSVALTGSSTEIRSLLGKTVVALNQGHSMDIVGFQKLYSSVKLVVHKIAPSMSDQEVAQLVYKLLNDETFLLERQSKDLTGKGQRSLQKDLRAKFSLDFKVSHKIYSGFKYFPLLLPVQGIVLSSGIIGGYIDLTELNKGLKIANTLLDEKLETDLKDLLVNKEFVKALSMLMMTPATSIVAPLWEEAACRGVLQDVLLTKAPRAFFKRFNKEHVIESKAYKIAKLLISAAVFSLMHLDNKSLFDKLERDLNEHPSSGGRLNYAQNAMNLQFFNTFAIGLVLAFVKEKTGSFWPAVGLHGAWNTIAVVGGLAKNYFSGSNAQPSAPPVRDDCF